MANTITSANSSFLLAVPPLYPYVPIQGYGVDDAFMTEKVVPTENKMGIDGHMSIGFINHKTKMTLKLAPDVESVALFDAWYAAMETAKDAFIAQAVIQLPSVGKVFTFVNGGLTGYTTMPPGKKVLMEQEYEIEWEQVLVSNI